MLAVYTNGDGGAAEHDQPAVPEVRRRRAPGRTSRSAPAAATATSFRPPPPSIRTTGRSCPVNTTTIYAFRRNGGRHGRRRGHLQRRRQYVVGAVRRRRRHSAPGQAFKAGGGLFGATDGTNVWLFVINTDTANSILYTKFNGRCGRRGPPFPARPPGRRRATSFRETAGRQRQIGLVWTQGTTNFDVMATSLNTGRGWTADAGCERPCRGRWCTGSGGGT